MDRDRDAWIDYAKAIGIILVVYGHVARGIFTAGLDMDPRIYEITDNIIYSFHMPLFFFLSGLFLLPSLAKRSHTNLLFNKVDTILYPLCNMVTVTRIYRDYIISIYKWSCHIL